MSGTLELGYDYSNNITRAVSVDATGKLEVVSSGGGGGGDATAANQVLQLAQETIIAGDTTSLDTKITACDTGAVVVSSSALPTGAATSLAQSSGNASLATISADTTSLDTKITTGEDDTLITAQQVLIYGRKDDSPSGLRAIKVVDNGAVNTNDGGLNGKISSGADATLVSAQQTVVYGRDSGGGLDALKVDNQGHLEVVQDTEQLTSLIFSGTQVIAGTAVHLFTAPLDKNGSTKFNLLISSSTNAADIEYTVDVGVSDDNSTFYDDANTGGGGGPPTVSQIANAQLSIIDQTSRYARFTITNNSLVNLTITSIKATRINGI